MQPVMAMVDRVADSDVSVLLRGESGVGKEVIARELHRRSDRRTQAVRQGELRGAAGRSARERAVRPRARRVHRRRHDARRQVRVRRARHDHARRDRRDAGRACRPSCCTSCRTGEFTRLGSNRPIDVDVRVIAATNRDLEAMMRAGTFREDLYYRLQVIEIHIPPLRERREEIRPLVEFFLAEVLAALPAAARCGRSPRLLRGARSTTRGRATSASSRT